MRQTAFAVPTRVLLAQAEELLRQLKAEVNAKRVLALGDFGVDGPKFTKALAVTHAELVGAETAQEGAKGDWGAGIVDDHGRAEAGFRWIGRLHNRVRNHIAEHGDKEDLAGQFRFGKLPVARTRGVVNELRLLLPECAEHAAKLKPFGVTVAFVAQGQKLLDAMAGKSAGGAAMDVVRDRTRDVRKAELKLSQHFERLVTADESVAEESADEAPLFRLDLVRAELARVEAVRAARLAAQGEAVDGLE